MTGVVTTTDEKHTQVRTLPTPFLLQISKLIKNRCFTRLYLWAVGTIGTTKDQEELVLPFTDCHRSTVSPPCLLHECYSQSCNFNHSHQNFILSCLLTPLLSLLAAKPMIETLSLPWPAISPQGGFRGSFVWPCRASKMLPKSSWEWELRVYEPDNHLLRCRAVSLRPTRQRK